MSIFELLTDGLGAIQDLARRVKLRRLAARSLIRDDRRFAQVGNRYRPLNVALAHPFGVTLHSLIV